ncbi:MAG: glycoside hydrolase family 3 protein [Gammaproteobacteria bacterium]
MDKDAEIDNSLSAFEKQVASRMMISLNDFSEQPVTELSVSLTELIQDIPLAGVILFASNFESIEQTIQLTHAIQASRVQDTLPLLIATDQEGGRVVRLPRHWSHALSGNMAIGATYPDLGIDYAQKTGTVLANELKALGINVNFAPTIDVNANPDNPVINTRSFGAQPAVVAKLGIAMIDAIQAQGVAAAAKHFPGHGDTDVDSHVGLPQVNRSWPDLLTTDLRPFTEVIAKANPAMVMAAHIQYPKLDPTTYRGKDDSAITTPATMSRKILHDVLRLEFNYQGVVVTDALDMAGVSDYFDPVDVVVETFRAGADIALMPFKNHSGQCGQALKEFIKTVSQRLLAAGYTEDEMQQSITRLNAVKTQFALPQRTYDEALEQAKQTFATSDYDEWQFQLAHAAITVIDEAHTLPLTSATNIEIIADERMQADYLKQAITQASNERLKRANVQSSVWSDLIFADDQQPLETTRLILIDDGYQSPVLEGGATSNRMSNALKRATLSRLLDNKAAGITNVLIALQSPYDVADFIKQSDATIFCYHAVLTKNPETGQLSSPAYDALANILTGTETATGRLPVSLKRSD